MPVQTRSQAKAYKAAKVNTVNVNVNFTGNGAKDLNSSQMEQVTKAITSTLRSTAFSQTSYNNANPGNPTKAPKEVTV